MEFRCPNCDSLIYSRKNKLCGKCGCILPPQLLFNEAQAKAVKKQMDETNKRWNDMQKRPPDTGYGGTDCL